MDNELSRILDESIQLELNVADLYLCFCQAFAEGKDDLTADALKEYLAR